MNMPLESEIIDIINCPSYQADRRYLENCIAQVYVLENKGSPSPYVVYGV